MKILKILGCIIVVTTLVLSGAHAYLNFETTTLDDDARAELNANFIELKHGKVHYQLVGSSEAPTVVLVHGFSMPSYLWDKNYDYLVNQGYRVLRFDLYGRGYSERPVIDYTIDLFVEQLVELTQTLKIDAPFHLVGISMGGAISTRFAHQYPDKLKSLSLLAPLVETPERADLKLIAMPGVGDYLATTLMMPKIKNNLAGTVYDVASYPEWDEKMAEHIYFHGYRQALLSTARHLTGKSFIEDYKKLEESSIPTQLIWGKEDQVVPFEQSQQVLNVAPSLSLHPLEKCGHLPQIEHAQKVNELLLTHFG